MDNKLPLSLSQRLGIDLTADFSLSVIMSAQYSIFSRFNGLHRLYRNEGRLYREASGRMVTDKPGTSIALLGSNEIGVSGGHAVDRSMGQVCERIKGSFTPIF